VAADLRATVDRQPGDPRLVWRIDPDMKEHNMSLAKVVSFVDDGPWCGTKPPGFHPPRPGNPMLIARLGSEVELNPQPIPPGSEIASYLWQAVRLHQFGQILSAAKIDGGAAESLFQAANRIYDDGQCGSVPWKVILQWLGHPPPPPPPWVDILGQAVGNAIMAQRLGGELGKQFQSAALGTIREQIGGEARKAA
jgi:hypothetical protein